jgi:hypothetical protein
MGQRNRTALLAAGLVALAIYAPGASAAANGMTVQGSLRGTSTWTPSLSVFGCAVSGPAESWVVSGTFDASFLGTGTYSGTLVRTAPAACSSVPFSASPPFPVAGTVRFAARGGEFVTGVLTGSTGYSIDLVHSTDYSFELEVAITSGTRRFSQLSGTLKVLYGTSFTTSLGCPCAPSDFGTLTGSLSLRAPS